MVEATLRLTPKQIAALTDKRPRRAYVGGIRSGKTFVGALDCVLKAKARPRTVTLATSNTYPQLRDVVIPALWKACDLLGVRWEFESQRKLIRLEGGAVILCRSLTIPQNLRGIEVGHWWGDEVRDYTREAIDTVMGRQSAFGVAYFWSTSPAGFGPLWEIMVRDADPEEVCLVRASTSDNPTLPADFEEQLRDAYAGTPELIAQELEGEFVSLKGSRCYKPFDRRLHASRPLAYNPAAPIFLCIDWNVTPLVCEVVQETRRVHRTGCAQNQANPDPCTCGGGLPVVDVVAEIVRHNSWVDDLAGAIVARYQHHLGDVWVNGDATEWQHRVSSQSGRTTWDLFEIALRNGLGPGARVRMDVPRKNPPQVDRVNSINYLLAHGRFHVDPSARMLIDDLEAVSWDRETGQIDKNADPMRTHASDAVGYRVYREHRPSAFNRETERLAGGL